ncbi:transketolase [Bradyrhizobium sp. USDA 336]|uniref:transketolase n=1 Tax=Bradyrhizobium sp. USDA 336 TaxID=3156311 RepID=UPI003836CE58
MEMTSNSTALLEKKCAEIRLNILQMIAEAGTGHPGSSLSCVELLVALYYRVMRFRPTDLMWKERDYLILSKGHAAPALYSILFDLGILPREDIWGLRKFGTALQGHPDVRFTSGVEVSTGSLGQGLSVGIGLALGAQRRELRSRTFVIVGDGESQEGQIWEAGLVASSLGLDNLCGIIDYNGIQHDGRVEDIISLSPLSEKWTAFGWETIEVDGHDIDAIVSALERPVCGRKPRMIIAKTIKGRGVSYMEDDWHWHSVADAARMRNDFAPTEAFNA